MFIGRKSELAFLNERYEDNKAECIILYGRRRVGKTALINEFCKDKPSIIFSAVKGNAQDNLAELSRVVMEYKYGLDNDISFSFSDLRSALNAVCSLADGKRFVFCIDELPYLAESIPSAMSVLQHFLDYEAKNAGLFIILSGSSISFMEEGVLSEKSPVYGRRTGQIKLVPFDYRETAEWFPSYSSEDKALIYGITGGVPYYMECFLGCSSIKDATVKSILSSNGLLYAEPSFLLREELKDSHLYDSILTAIAEGNTRLSEIASKVGIETGACSAYMKALMNLGFIRKDCPVGSSSSRKTLYRLDDFFLMFWYRFVYRFSSVVASRKGAELYDKIIVPRLSEYMGFVFERMAYDYVLKYADVPFLIKEIGRWWGGNPKTGKEAEIDIVALSAENPDEGIIASCKYRNRKVGSDELDLMKEYGDAMCLIRKRYYWMFSKSGFSEELKPADDIRLITLDEMYM